MHDNGSQKTLIRILTFRLLAGRNNRRYMSSIFTILGITAGFITIFVIIGVMNGLQQGYLQDLMELDSFHAQLLLAEDADTDRITEVLNKDYPVVSVVRYKETDALIPYGYKEYLPCRIRGVSDELFSDERFLAYAHLDRTEQISLGKLDVIISSYMRAVLSTGKGATVEFVLMKEGKTARHVPIRVETAVADIYHSDFPDIDSAMIYGSYSMVDTLLPNTKEHIGLKIEDPQDLSWLTKLESIEGVEKVSSWKQVNQSFYSALMMEKYGMLILLSLIFLVVIMNAKSSFEKYVFHKKDAIGILRALGATKSAMYASFILQGSLVVLIGIVLGSSLGMLFVQNLNQVIRFAEQAASFISGSPVTLLMYEFPVAIDLQEMLILAAAVLLLSMVNVYFAIRPLMRKTPLEMIWYE